MAVEYRQTFLNPLRISSDCRSDALLSNSDLTGTPVTTHLRPTTTGPSPRGESSAGGTFAYPRPRLGSINNQLRVAERSRVALCHKNCAFHRMFGRIPQSSTAWHTFNNLRATLNQAGHLDVRNARSARKDFVCARMCRVCATGMCGCADVRTAPPTQ